MPINMFTPETQDGEEEAAQQMYADIAGVFKAGYQDEDGEPHSVQSFIMAVSDPDVAAALQKKWRKSELRELDEAKNDEIYQVWTETAKKVPVLLEGTWSVRTSLVLWGADRQMITETDGTYKIVNGELTDEEDPLAAGKSRDELKSSNFKPSIQVRFRIQGLEDLGLFRFFSGSWTALEDFAGVEALLHSIEGPATAELGLELIKGKKFDFVKPFLKKVRPVADN